MPEKTAAEFLAHYRGMPNNILMTACSWAGVGVDYRGSSKPMMAEDYAGGKGSTGVAMGLGPISLAQIDERIVDLYAKDMVSTAQSIKVFNWLRKHELLQAVDARKRELIQQARGRRG